MVHDAFAHRPAPDASGLDLDQGVEAAIVAARFHQGLVQAVVQTAWALADEHALDTVVLGGGVFQNRLLLEGVSETLRERGLRVLSPERLPANDGGLALGQAVIAAARRLRPATARPAD